VPNTVAPDTETSIVETAEPPVPEVLLNPLEITNGQKLWDMVITQPGESGPLINLPAFACFLDAKTGNDILNNRGVLIEVAKKSINPDSVGSALWPAEQALPGEVGAVQVFAHRTTDVSPDRDGDGFSDQVPPEVIFEHLDLIRSGASLELQLFNGKTVRYEALASTDGIGGNGVIAGPEGLAYKIVENVQDAQGDTNIENTHTYRNQDTGGRKLFRTVACHDKGSAQHRIVVEWVQTSP
jgi:hypothetical protein